MNESPELVKHLEYLEHVSSPEEALITPETAAQAREAWEVFRRASGDAMAIPDACVGPDGRMLYVWNRGRYHLELEIIPGAPTELFYLDRESREVWGEDYHIGDPLPAFVAERLHLWAPAPGVDSADRCTPVPDCRSLGVESPQAVDRKGLGNGTDPRSSPGGCQA